MKEYLINNNGEYELHQGGIVPDGAIEVPEGATHYLTGRFVKFSDGTPFFLKVDGFDEYEYYDGCWNLRDNPLNPLYFNGSSLLWQRPTQPEELPFVDDGTQSLNDQYAEIEKVRHAHYFKDVSDINEIDVYEVLHRFGVTDPCLQHIVKKALCAGERGHKDFHTDLKNIADTAQRMLEIHGL